MNSLVNARSPISLAALDDYKVWPFKHRHWTFEIAEDEHHDIWVSTRDLRDFWAKFTLDKELSRVYHRSLLFDKRTKTLYVPARVMRLELMKSRPYSQHGDILKFLDAFDRHVNEVMARKRINRHLGSGKPFPEDIRATVTGPRAPSLAPPRLEAATVPFTSEERHAIESPYKKDEPRFAFRPEAMPIRQSWGSFLSTKATAGWGWVKSVLKGEKNLFWTTLGLAFVISRALNFTTQLLLPADVDWTRDYRWIAWFDALIAVLAIVLAGIYLYALTQCARRTFERKEVRVLVVVHYLFFLPIAPMIVEPHFEGNPLGYWWEIVSGRSKPIDVYADPVLGRIVARGRIRAGSAEALERVVLANPRMTLLQIESPGGFTSEGFRMANLVADQKLDTVSREGCASACTLVLVAGRERYVGDSARISFHRSGFMSQFDTHIDYGWSRTDQKMKAMFEAKGVHADFIHRAFKEPIWRIWDAPLNDLLDSGYATATWANRKAGY